MEKIQAICIISSNRTNMTSTCFELPWLLQIACTFTEWKLEIWLILWGGFNLYVGAINAANGTMLWSVVTKQDGHVFNWLLNKTVLCQKEGKKLELYELL